MTPSLPARGALALLRAYMKYVSPLTGGSCRFHPTCSEYARQALLEHGMLKGLALAAWRLLRCQPLCAGGEDPVPPARRAARAGPPGRAAASAPRADRPRP